MVKTKQTDSGTFSSFGFFQKLLDMQDEKHTSDVKQLGRRVKTLETIKVDEVLVRTQFNALQKDIDDVAEKVEKPHSCTKSGSISRMNGDIENIGSDVKEMKKSMGRWKTVKFSVVIAAMVAIVPGVVYVSQLGNKVENTRVEVSNITKDVRSIAKSNKEVAASVASLTGEKVELKKQERLKKTLVQVFRQLREEEKKKKRR